MAEVTAVAPSASEAAASAIAVLLNITILLVRNERGRVGGLKEMTRRPSDNRNAFLPRSSPVQMSQSVMSRSDLSQRERSQVSIGSHLSSRAGGAHDCPYTRGLVSSRTYFQAVKVELGLRNFHQANAKPLASSFHLCRFHIHDTDRILCRCYSSR